MVTHQSRGNDPTGRWSEGSERSGGRGAGSLLVATLLGVGIGLLAAPQPGTKTRKLLQERLAALGEGMGEGLEEVQGASSRTRKRLKRRLAKLREEAVEGRQRVQERWSKSRRELEEDHDEDEESGSY